MARELAGAADGGNRIAECASSAAGAAGVLDHIGHFGIATIVTVAAIATIATIFFLTSITTISAVVPTVCLITCIIGVDARISGTTAIGAAGRSVAVAAWLVLANVASIR